MPTQWTAKYLRETPEQPVRAQSEHGLRTLHIALHC